MSDALSVPAVVVPHSTRVIFTHVPKVAGTAVMRRLVRANFEPELIKDFRGVRDLITTRRDYYSALVGHSVYDMHRFMSGECRYFTMLRDPEARAISHYFFIKQPPLDPDFRGNAAQRALHNRLELADIFDHTAYRRFRLMGTWLIDNMQTRYIAGWTQHWRAPASRALLEIAKRNLRDNYAAFGLQDRFEDSLARIAGAFDWEIGPDDGGKSKQTRIDKTMTEADIDAVRQHNMLDAELYDYAQELFRQRATAI